MHGLFPASAPGPATRATCLIQQTLDGIEFVAVEVTIKLEDVCYIAEIIDGEPRPLYAEPDLIPVRAAVFARTQEVRQRRQN